MDLATESEEVDWLLLGEDGSGMVYYMDKLRGVGVLYYTPRFKGNLNDGVSILVDFRDRPTLVSYNRMSLLLSYNNDRNADLFYMDPRGKTHYFYGVTIPYSLEQFILRTGEGDSSSGLILDFLKNLSMSSIALSIASSANNDFEIGSLWNEIEMSSEEYKEFKYKKSYSSVINDFAGGVFAGKNINPADVAKEAIEKTDNLLSKRNSLTDKLEKTATIVNLRVDEDNSLCGRRNLVITCGPSAGTYIVNVGYWGEPYNASYPFSLAVNDVDWLEYWDYGNNRQDPMQMAVTVTENTGNSTREGVIQFIEDIPASITIRQKGKNDSFKLSETALEFGSEGGEQLVTVQTPPGLAGWYVSGAPDWCHISYEDGGFRIAVDRNNGDRDDTCYLTVTSRREDLLYDSEYYSISLFQANGHGCPDTHHPHAIDLGLSVKWACMNMGAERYEDDGDYFAWGETSTKNDYSWENYKWGIGKSPQAGPPYDYQPTKYVSHYFEGYDYSYYDKKLSLDPSDDAATVNWGDGWRMPTQDEAAELVNNCTWTWISRNNVYCMKVTGPNGNYIILPITHEWDGIRQSTSLFYGRYWTSSLVPYNDGSIHAFDLSFSNASAQYVNSDYYSLRSLGIAVRPVKE